jgi:GntR family transcriptional regulator
VQIQIAPGDGVPIYVQIANQVKFLVASGRLAPGEELPPIRALAERLLINPNTVARAYRELELAGVVTKRRTAGTYVSESASAIGQAELIEIVTCRVDALLAEARQLGVGLDELLDLVRRRGEAPDPPKNAKG